MPRSRAGKRLEALFSSGRIAELILAVMALEAIALIAWRHRPMAPETR